MTSNFLIISFYTRDTPYELEAQRLITSLKRFNLPFHVEEVENKGSWVKNCNFKAEFCKNMLKSSEVPIVWLDCDAEVCSYPHLFNDLSNYDLAVATSHKPSNPGEILSGTLFFNKTDGAELVLDCWVRECGCNEGRWDQKNLQKVLTDCQNQIKVFDLPPNYAKIFDNRSTLAEEAVIIHWQASRRYKRQIC